ncbi:MAG: hypothetical protein U1F36_05515 [Planctomycetota bacterium]
MIPPAPRRRRHHADVDAPIGVMRSLGRAVFWAFGIAAASYVFLAGSWLLLVLSGSGPDPGFVGLHDVEHNRLQHALIWLVGVPVLAVPFVLIVAVFAAPWIVLYTVLDLALSASLRLEIRRPCHASWAGVIAVLIGLRLLKTSTLEWIDPLTLSLFVVPASVLLTLALFGRRVEVDGHLRRQRQLHAQHRPRCDAR